MTALSMRGFGLILAWSHGFSNGGNESDRIPKKTVLLHKEGFLHGLHCCPGSAWQQLFRTWPERLSLHVLFQSLSTGEGRGLNP